MDIPAYTLFILKKIDRIYHFGQQFNNYKIGLVMRSFTKRQYRQKSQQNDDESLNTPSQAQIFQQTQHHYKTNTNYKQEESSRPEYSSICASIAEQLPQLLNNNQRSDFLDKQKMMHDLIETNVLKDEALIKATKMIELLEREIKGANQQAEQLRVMIASKQDAIKKLQKQLKAMKTSQYYEVNNVVTFNQDEEAFPEQQQGLRQHKVRSKSQIFYEATRNKISHPNRMNTFVINSLRDQRQINFTKQLTPLTSRSLPKHTHSAYQHQPILQNLGHLIVQQQIQNMRMFRQQINKMLAVDMDERQDMNQQLKKNVYAFESLLVDDYSIGYSTSFQFLNKHTARTENRPPQDSIQEIITHYNKLIQQYQEYASYLKLYLCQSINFINQGNNTHATNSNKDHHNSAPFISLVYQDIMGLFQERWSSIQKQNQELKFILEQLIKNIQFCNRKGDFDHIKPYSKKKLTNLT